MNTVLTRISKRAREVLDSLAEKDQVKLSALVAKINSSGGMAAQLIKSHPGVLKTRLTKRVNLNDILEDAFFTAIRMGHTYVGTEHLLLAGLARAEYMGLEALNSEVERLNSLPVLVRNSGGAEKVPLLNTYGVDLTKRYIFYPKEFFVEREEVDKMFKVLLQKNNSNVLLVGEKGVGKRSLIEVMARRISYLDVPAYFVGPFVIDFNLQAFMSGISPTVDTFESAIRNLANELKLLGRSMLVVKNFPGMFLAGLPGNNAASVFRSFIETLNEVGAKVIVSLDCDSYDKVLGSADEMFDSFTVIDINEPAPKVTLKIVKLEAEKLENYFLLKIPSDVVDYVFKRARLEVKDQIFPQKALLLLDKACALAAFDETKVPKPIKSLVKKHVDLSLKIEEAFIDKNFDEAVRLTGLVRKLEKGMNGRVVYPIGKRRKVSFKDVDKALETYREEEAKDYKIGTKKLSDLEHRLKQRIIGQDGAVEVVVKALIRAQMGLRPRNKPVGNFLFLGPTGVGKTELAKVLAQEAFGEGSLIRLDMSDFSEKHTVSRLVGAPPGYIGYTEGGELTSKISQKPQSVVLFDEIEKAHPEVLNILLQIMEEGQLTDMRGESFSFSAAVIILTSNLGTELIHKKDIGYGEGKKSQKEIENRVTQSIKTFLKPELINRFDEVITFRQLEEEDSKRILDLLLKEVHQSLALKNVRLAVDARVKALLLKRGFSLEFGARSLRRTVEKELLDRIASFMLEKKSGSRSIKAKVLKDSIVIAG